MFDYFFFIIYIFLDFEKSIALNKFDLSNPSINVDCIHKNPEKEECMKDIGAGREGRKLRKEEERGIEKGGGEGEREWRHGRRGGKREKSMGPKGWQSFPSPLFFRFVRTKRRPSIKLSRCH